MVKLLVVDDDPAMRTIMRLTLEDEGYSVDLAEDGCEALSRLAATEPALLLLDLHMPGLAGSEVCRRVRNERRRLPIVVLRDRGRLDVTDAVDAADACLVKPFDLDELVHVVKQLTVRGVRTVTEGGVRERPRQLRGSTNRAAGRTARLGTG